MSRLPEKEAENAVSFDDDKLKLISWSGKKAVTILQPPGQPRSLKISSQGVAWIFLDWEAPVEGGKPKEYKIQRRLRSGGNWQDVATAVLTKTTLVNQPQGKELEYHVIAVNKSGPGAPSNTVMAVL